MSLSSMVKQKVKSTIHLFTESHWEKVGGKI